MQLCCVITFECVLCYCTLDPDVDLQAQELIYLSHAWVPVQPCDAEGLTISRAPLMTPQRTLQYLRALQFSGSSTKSTRGLSSNTCCTTDFCCVQATSLMLQAPLMQEVRLTRLQAVLSAFQLETAALALRNILKPTYKGRPVISQHLFLHQQQTPPALILLQLYLLCP